MISARDAVAWGVTGPSLRGSGVNWDIRKAIPYSAYDHFDFDVPLADEGDVYARFWVRGPAPWQRDGSVRPAPSRRRSQR